MEKGKHLLEAISGHWIPVIEPQIPPAIPSGHERSSYGIGSNLTSTLLRRLAQNTTSKVPLAHSVLDRSFSCCGGLCECCWTTERSCQRVIVHADDTHVLYTTDSSTAGHSGWHLHLDREICLRDAVEWQLVVSGDVLSDCSLLEGVGVCSTWCRIDHGG